MTTASFESPERALRVVRWPSEVPLRVLVLLAALGLWIAIVVSLIGAFYALLLGLFFFFAHLAFVFHLRGNAVRLGPEQLPELYARVEQISRRVGLRQTPEAYLVQAGGSLNALATRFLGRNFIVLYSDLVEACGENEDARDFVIAHELGHLAAGHLAWRWLLIPGLALPFLGHAYSRACEYTSDRYGFAACGERAAALDGLCILAAGGQQGPLVNRRALVAQREDLATPWMTIGRWLSTHPPIAHRLEALEPALAAAPLRAGGAALGAVAILITLLGVPTAAGVGFAVGLWPSIQQGLQAQPAAGPGAAPRAAGSAEQLRPVVERDILALVEVAESYRASAGELPPAVETLYQAWGHSRPGEPIPIDPFDGQRYGYSLEGGDFVLWSAGPDPDDPEDNLYYSSAEAGR